MAGHYWLSRGGSVYAPEASEASAEILTSRIGQEGPDIPPRILEKIIIYTQMKIFDSRAHNLLENDQTRSRQLRTH